MWFAENCGLNVFGIEPLPTLLNQAPNSIGHSSNAPGKTRESDLLDENPLRAQALS